MCLFCNIPLERVIASNEFAYAIRDGFPVSEFHTLIIPKRHFSDYFSLTEAELIACNQMILQMKNDITAKDDSVIAFNIGVNVGAASGQTIFHCHIHLIPRRLGDVENPRGGIRHVIPSKGYYIDSL